MDNVRYRLAPQMIEYDRLGQVWRPYLMHFHPPHFRSAAVSTDGFGLRYTDDGVRRYTAIEGRDGAPASVVVGGSAVFGVGVTADSRTVPSILASEEKSVWLNLGGRAFTGAQELMLFQTLASRIGVVKRLVIMSGVNDLFLPALTSSWDPVLGACYFQSQFESGMEEAALSPKRRWARALLGPLVGSRIDFARASWGEISQAVRHSLPGSRAGRDTGGEVPTIDADQVIARALSQVRKNLTVWAIVAKGMGCDLTYFLQPTAQWSNHASSAEEAAIFEFLEAQQSAREWDIVNLLSRDVYVKYADKLHELCGELGVRMVDLNQCLSPDAFNGRWLYVDRGGHFTDEGSAAVASYVLGVL